ncbi:hypothetical protein [Mesorhizobium marinum]|uniref:hypothetical protein n=1 Tax=Mesorhizobium marinum TaxID=3228790 RepID=UPI003466713B
MSASSRTRSASAGRTADGSADDATSALIFNVTEPSASETSPENFPASASLPRLPSVTVRWSVDSTPARPALILPATSGATVGLSMTSAEAVAVPVTGPVLAWILKASECSSRARFLSSALSVATRGSTAAISRFGSRPSPSARTEARLTSMSIGLSSVPKERRTPPPVASICTAKSLAPSGSRLPDAVAVIAALSMRARSMSTPPPAVSRPARSKLALPASSGRRVSGRKRSNSPSPVASTALPLSVNWCLASTRVTTAPSTANVPLPDQSAAGPLPATSIATAGSPGSFSRLAMMPPPGSAARTSMSRRLSPGAKSILASMLPARPSLRATLSWATTWSGDVPALAEPLAETEATPPASAGPRATSGRSIFLMSTATGSEKDPCSSFGLLAGRGARATSMRSAWTRSATNVAARSFSGDQSTATLRATNHGPCPSPRTTLATVSSPDQMPSMPATLTVWPGDDAKSEMSPARLSLPRSVSVSTASAPTTSASAA